ncbi:MAG: DUF4145 domain-containing protein [Campylobacterota bacterium]
MTFIAPTVFSEKFTCPNCDAIALQRWEARSLDFNYYSLTDNNPLRTAKCDHCNGFSIWYNEKMLFPNIGLAPQPNTDLPDSVKEIYLEASAISSTSPRGAAALLRLAVQILCKELGEEGKNINSDIAELVKKGLPERVQQALDIVRVTGNNSVHPGQIDVDNPEVVGNLFGLINVIAEYTISMPKRISGIYEELPEGAVNAIKKRDQ